MNNRIAVTVRMNLEEQREMRELAVFYKKDPKTLMKLAFSLLIETTKKVQQDMAEREKSLAKPNTVIEPEETT